MTTKISGDNGVTFPDDTVQSTSSVMPAGAILAFAMQSNPNGWIVCNGQSVSKQTFPALFNAIGYTYGGAGDYFNVPDLRGYFVRGWDNGRGVDSGRVFGSNQADEFKSHTHTYTLTYNYQTNVPIGSPNAAQVGFTPNTNTGATGGSETRPKNIAMNYCIKY